MARPRRIMTFTLHGSYRRAFSAISFAMCEAASSQYRCSEALPTSLVRMHSAVDTPRVPLLAGNWQPPPSTGSERTCRNTFHGHVRFLHQLRKLFFQCYRSKVFLVVLVSTAFASGSVLESLFQLLPKGHDPCLPHPGLCTMMWTNTDDES